MKVFSILALARAMDVPNYLRSKQGFTYALTVLACPVFLIASQPDLGSAMVLVPIGAAMFLAAGARWRHMGSVIGSCLAFAPIAWMFILKDYQKIRILSFMDPASDQSGAAYQSIRSLAAVGSGKITGMGWGQGPSSKLGLLPDRHTDFIFSIIAEEWGFVGSVAILGLFGLLFLFSLEVAYRTRDPFGRLIVVGATTLLFFQLVVNVGMATGLAPITGLTLPFISYGGSSLLTTAVAIGLVVSVGRHEPPTIAA